MIKKRFTMVRIFSVSFLFLFTVQLSNPAQASVVKSGVGCTKINTTIKVGTKVYRCGKNPFFKPNSLTWTLRGCFTANSLLKESRSQFESWKDLAKLAGPDGEKTLQDLQNSITDLENTMKNEVCKKGS